MNSITKKPHPSRYMVVGASAGLAAVAGLTFGCGEEKKAEAAPPFTEVAVKFEQPLNAVWVASSTVAWAVGNGGLIVQFDGTQWKKVESPTTENLLAVWGTGADSVWAVGEKGVIAVRHEGAWTATMDRRELTLRTVAGQGPEDVWILGDEGVALRSTGGDFSDAPAPLPTRVQGLYMDATGAGYFVGFESGVGTVTATYDGAGEWTRVVRSDTGIGSITDIWGRIEPQERVPFLWGAGTNTAGNGLLARWQDNHWNIVSEGLNRPVAVLPTDEGLWLGASGMLIRVDLNAPDAPETYPVAGSVRDLQGVAGLLVAVGGDTDGRIWARVPDAL